MSRTLEDLARLSKRELAALFDAGSPVDPESLTDWEFRGYNQPLFTKIAGFQKFRKGFYEHEGAHWGYNINVLQGPLARPWTSKPSDDAPRRFGFFSITPAETLEPGALLFNYGDGKNRLLEGSFLRDYVRQVERDNPDLLLGKAYSAVGSARLMPSYFTIQRDRRAPTPVRHPA